MPLLSITDMRLPINGLKMMLKKYCRSSYNFGWMVLILVTMIHPHVHAHLPWSCWYLTKTSKSSANILSAFGKIGIDASHKRLFDQCVKYKHGEDDLVKTWNCKIADSLVEMDFNVILREQPMQFHITNSETRQVTMSQTDELVWQAQSQEIPT